MVAVLKDSFAAQSGHWYRPDGKPAYEIEGANGRLRPTTLRDARKLGLYPSVTTILKAAAAPGLERWKIGNAILSALTLPRSEGESDESYIDRIVRDSEEQARKARDTGTEIHGAIEKHYLGRMHDDDPWTAHAYAAREEVEKWAGPVTWDAERSFSSRLGYGGKLDLSCDGFLVDFKTTDKPLDGLKLWPDHRRQLAAYRMGLWMPKARCAICYASSAAPGARLIELGQDELVQGWDEFRALLEFWRAANNYFPMG
jgi:hypothetical protein